MESKKEAEIAVNLKSTQYNNTIERAISKLGWRVSAKEGKKNKDWDVLWTDSSQGMILTSHF